MLSIDRFYRLHGFRFDRCGLEAYYERMLMDLHVHTLLSPCSRLALTDIFDQARALGLGGVCLTDHDTMGAADVLPIHETRGDTRGLVVIVGMEYSSPDGDFLLFGPMRNLDRGLGASELLPEVQARGGVAVAAHPFREGRSVSPWVLESGLCRVVEIVNGRNDAVENRQALQWLQQSNQSAQALALTGGSDAHAVNELGQVPTLFHAPIRNESDLIRALLNGLCEPAEAMGGVVGL